MAKKSKLSAIRTWRGFRQTLGQLKITSMQRMRNGISYWSTLMSCFTKVTNSQKPAKSLKKGQNIIWRCRASTWTGKSQLLNLLHHPRVSRASPTQRVLAPEPPRRTTGPASMPNSAPPSPSPPLVTEVSKKYRIGSTPSPPPSINKARFKGWNNNSRPLNRERNLPCQIIVLNKDFIAN